VIGFLPKNRPVVASHVDPADWLLDRWHLQALPRRSAVHDLALKPRHSRALQHIALPGDLGYRFSWWYSPRALLHICFLRVHPLQSAFSSWKACLLITIDCCRRLLALLSLHRSLEFFLGLLDSSQQCQNQPIIWCHPRHGHGRPHL